MKNCINGHVTTAQGVHNLKNPVQNFKSLTFSKISKSLWQDFKISELNNYIVFGIRCYDLLTLLQVNILESKIY